MGSTRVRHSLPLFEASANGNAGRLAELIEFGTLSLDGYDATGLTPLVLAVQHSQEACVNLLLKHGASVNLATKDKARLTPLHVALGRTPSPLPRLVEALLAAGADAFKAFASSGKSCFHVAVERGDVALLETLLARLTPAQRAKALCTPTNPGGESPAALAGKAGRVAVLEWLIENGVTGVEESLEAIAAAAAAGGGSSSSSGRPSSVSLSGATAAVAAAGVRGSVRRTSSGIVTSINLTAGGAGTAGATCSASVGGLDAKTTEWLAARRAARGNQARKAREAKEQWCALVLAAAGRGDLAGVQGAVEALVDSGSGGSGGTPAAPLPLQPSLLLPPPGVSLADVASAREAVSGKGLLHLAIDALLEGTGSSNSPSALLLVKFLLALPPIAAEAAAGGSATAASAPALDRGLDPNVADRRGLRPLARAALAGHVGLAVALLEAGADPRDRTRLTLPLIEEAVKAAAARRLAASSAKRRRAAGGDEDGDPTRPGEEEDAEEGDDDEEDEEEDACNVEEDADPQEPQAPEDEATRLARATEAARASCPLSAGRTARPHELADAAGHKSLSALLRAAVSACRARDGQPDTDEEGVDDGEDGDDATASARPRRRLDAAAMFAIFNRSVRGNGGGAVPGASRSAWQSFRSKYTVGMPTLVPGGAGRASEPGSGRGSGAVTPVPGSEGGAGTRADTPGGGDTGRPLLPLARQPSGSSASEGSSARGNITPSRGAVASLGKSTGGEEEAGLGVQSPASPATVALTSSGSIGSSSAAGASYKLLRVRLWLEEAGLGSLVEALTTKLGLKDLALLRHLTLEAATGLGGMTDLHCAAFVDAAAASGLTLHPSWGVVGEGVPDKRSDLPSKTTPAVDKALQPSGGAGALPDEPPAEAAAAAFAPGVGLPRSLGAPPPSSTSSSLRYRPAPAAGYSLLPVAGPTGTSFATSAELHAGLSAIAGTVPLGAGLPAASSGLQGAAAAAAAAAASSAFGLDLPPLASNASYFPAPTTRPGLPPAGVPHATSAFGLDAGVPSSLPGLGLGGGASWTPPQPLSKPSLAPLGDGAVGLEAIGLGGLGSGGVGLPSFATTPSFGLGAGSSSSSSTGVGLDIPLALPGARVGVPAAPLQVPPSLSSFVSAASFPALPPALVGWVIDWKALKPPPPPEACQLPPPLPAWVLANTREAATNWVRCGRGAYGDVFWARYDRKDVAVKTIRGRSGLDPAGGSSSGGAEGALSLPALLHPTPSHALAVQEALSAVLHEVKVHRALKPHPNVVACFGVAVESHAQALRRAAEAAARGGGGAAAARAAAEANAVLRGSSDALDAVVQIGLVMDLCPSGSAEDLFVDRAIVLPPPPAATAVDTGALEIADDEEEEEGGLHGPQDKDGGGAGGSSAAGGGGPGPGLNSSSFCRYAGIKLPTLVALCADAARGLAHLHACGVVHGDVSARNLLLVARASPSSAPAWGAPLPPASLAATRWTGKLGDFGFARVVATSASTLPSSSPGSGSLTRSVSSSAGGRPAVGPIRWWPPEALVGGSYTPASDVFSLGVLLYELLAGRRPWAGWPNTSVAAHVLTGKRLPAAEHIPDPALAKLVSACWAHEPAARPSAAEVLRRLENWLADSERATFGVYGRLPARLAVGEVTATAPVAPEVPVTFATAKPVEPRGCSANDSSGVAAANTALPAPAATPAPPAPAALAAAPVPPSSPRSAPLPAPSPTSPFRLTRPPPSWAAAAAAASGGAASTGGGGALPIPPRLPDDTAPPEPSLLEELLGGDDA